ncbi:hypothetical protein D9613_003572 [Agrocybe pediades]|uniref:Uncharacterized protein n=1 Tax=Agrocybe pediades TaxID=84607 RepID=A0A8H4QIR8_9AGAR|nr:hypothetical protein D9613_003572 [Agrocybe pediades]
MSDDSVVRSEKALVSAAIHASLLYMFLMGAYLALYIGTIYIYCRKRERSRRLVVVTLTVLCLTLAAQTGIQWYMVDAMLGGATRELIADGGGGPVAGVVSTALINFGYVLADGLLIWRAYQACGRAIISICLPLFFFVLEIGLGIGDVAIDVALEVNPHHNRALRIRQFEIIDGSLSGAVAATSLLSTYTIARRIHTALSNSPKRSRKAYWHIVEIVVQSSVIYSIAVLVNAVFDFVNSTVKDFSDVQIIAGDYVTNITTIVTGLAPTLMVARLALWSDTVSTELGTDETEFSSTEHTLEGHSQGMHPDESNESVQNHRCPDSVENDTAP